MVFSVFLSELWKTVYVVEYFFHFLYETSQRLTNKLKDKGEIVEDGDDMYNYFKNTSGLHIIWIVCESANINKRGRALINLLMGCFNNSMHHLLF